MVEDTKDMGLVLRLKRKTYSNDEGMSTGKKVALGIAGTAATAGAAFLGAKKGMFGANAMRGANSLYGTAGAYAKRMGANKIGTSMMNSGAKGVQTAQTNIAKDVLSKKSNYAIQSAGGADKLANRAGENVARIKQNRWNEIANGGNQAVI